jgi:hypothetical protein
VDALRDNGGVVKELGGDRYQAQCPAHDDTDPSLSIGPRRNGDGVVLKCHAGCEYTDVLAALKLKPTDLFDEPDKRDAYADRARYEYRDGRTVHRAPGKKFRQSGNTKGTELFHAENITAATEYVYVAEGEKDVLAIESEGAVAVCSPMGTGKAAKFDWSPLTGKRVIIVADRDESGRKHARETAGLLRCIAASVGIVIAAGGKDAADHIANGYPLDELVAVGGDGAALLDDLVGWFARFIAVTDVDDLSLLALWTAHTFLVNELYTSPRLLIDSIMEGSGKSTVIDHLNRLCLHPVQAATISSPALIPRLLEYGMRTILLDEAHRALRPDRPGVDDLLGIINTGYRYGATRPVLMPVKGGGWDAAEMSTFAPVAMAGNNPHLPADTVSRQIRILLMPDIDGTIEDSDWEHIETDAAALKARIADWAASVRDGVRGMDVELPPGCIGRCKEKWRPLARVAAAAGGHWPATVYRLTEADMAQEAAEREAGLKKLPPGMVAMRDLWVVWPEGEAFMPTRELVAKLIWHNPEYWGTESPYGKPLTDTRLGLLIDQATKVTSGRPGGRGPRGYLRSTLEPVWHRLGIGRKQPGALGYPGEPGAEQPPITGLTDLTGSTGLTETPTQPGAEDKPTCDTCGVELTQRNSIARGRCTECVLSANTEQP